MEDTNQHHPYFSRDGCEWHGHCLDIPIETIAHIYGFVNALFASAELLCYTVLCTALHVILEKQKDRDKNVCDMSLKTFEDPDDDCEVKASKVVAALLATSVFEVLLSFLALRGAYTTNVYFCYIWFVFTSLLVIVFPLFQSLFFVVTNWWNSISYTIMSMSVIHSLFKLYGMFVIVRFVKWARTHKTEGENHTATDEEALSVKSLPASTVPSGRNPENAVAAQNVDIVGRANENLPQDENMKQQVTRKSGILKSKKRSTSTLDSKKRKKKSKSTINSSNV